MRRNDGFTLIEVVVALAIGGVLLLIASQVFSGVTSTTRELNVARTALDRQVNAERWLASVFLSVEAGQDAGGFAGHPNYAEFSAWIRAPDGWYARHRIAVEICQDRLMAISNSDSIVLADSVRGLDLDYLLEPGADARWAREWVSPVTAPLAIRLRIRRASRADTLLFVIGERG